MHRGLRKRLELISAFYDVKVEWAKVNDLYLGYYHGDKMTITVVRHPDVDVLCTSFFHELSHVLDHRSGIFNIFYNTRNSRRKRAPWALRAERHTDLRGKKLCNELLPMVRYIQSYRTKTQVKHLRQMYRGLVS